MVRNHLVRSLFLILSFQYPVSLDVALERHCGAVSVGYFVSESRYLEASALSVQRRWLSESPSVRMDIDVLVIPKRNRAFPTP
ncbi:hypothetical protein B0F90DRAFT_1721640 [Multifurca ochricompacta]|uniref:Secreted protein n=1 Tax=Multifurca ochricompacta TaxID=376703 RepID=A0AAD4QNJ7_9AGAM|nr:hypothetical protein B0F90DRAFT_1721640 [Multifurca ochricompacta]